MTNADGPRSPRDRRSDDEPLPSADRVEHLDRVAVVGAGPTGACAALALALAGVPVTLFEKGDDLSSESRASTFHPATLELLDELGVADAVVGAGLRAPRTQFRDRRDGPVATFDLGVLADVTRYPFRVQLEQDKATRIVLDRLRAGVTDGRWDAEVRMGWRAHGVTGQADDHVGVVMGTDDGHVEVRAPWVIAADGAHSAVRTSLGITLDGETYPERFLVVSVADELRDLVDDLELVNYVADPDEWLVLLRTPDHWRVLFPVVDADPDPDPNGDPDGDPAAETSPDEIARRLDGATGGTGHAFTVLAASRYVVSRRVADRMRAGRVLLAGDAAHQNSPLGGMGMNSGIQDAVSAARRLAEVWHGRGDDDLLDDYDRRRREVAVGYVQADAHANWLALRERDPARRAALRAELVATAADPVRHRARMERTAMLDAVRDSL